jgi:hypothetical protein
MHSELTNLLPSSKTKAFRHEYFLRIITVALVLLAILVIIHGILLIPSYLYTRDKVSAESAELNNLSKTLETTQAQQAQTQLTALKTESTYLSRLSSTTQASATIRTVLAVSRSGIALTGFVFTPPLNGAAGTVQISGTAATREQLSSYYQELETLPFVASANLPISDYAKESDIPFTITLTDTLPHGSTS